MRLYGYWRSSASWRIRIILNVKGLPWKYEPVALNRDEHLRESYRKVTPMGLVPVLDTGNGTLGQSPAIAEFLEERYPEPPLLPTDPFGRAGVRELQSLLGCDVHPLQNLRVLKHLRDRFGQDDEGVADWCRHWIAAGFDAFEQLAARHSGDGRHAWGESLTLADVWLIPQVYNAERWGLALDPYPTIAAIARHCNELEPVAAAHPSKQPDAPAT